MYMERFLWNNGKIFVPGRPTTLKESNFYVCPEDNQPSSCSFEESRRRTNLGVPGRLEISSSTVFVLRGRDWKKRKKRVNKINGFKLVCRRGEINSPPGKSPTLEPVITGILC